MPLPGPRGGRCGAELPPKAARSPPTAPLIWSPFIGNLHSEFIVSARPFFGNGQAKSQRPAATVRRSIVRHRVGLAWNIFNAENFDARFSNAFAAQTKLRCRSRHVQREFLTGNVADLTGISLNVKFILSHANRPCKRVCNCILEYAESDV